MAQVTIDDIHKAAINVFGEAELIRTDRQNNSMHKWFRDVAQALAEKDYDFREIKIEISPTEELVKEYMFKPVAKAMFGVGSTTQLETRQVSQVYEQLNRLLANKFAIHVPWPEEEKK